MDTCPESRDDGTMNPVPKPVMDAGVPGRPRVWTVFVDFLLLCVALLISQILIVVGLAVWLVTHGTKREDLSSELVRLMTQPGAVIGIGLVSQAIIGLAAILPAILSPRPFRSRLGLLRPALPVWGFPVLVLGALVPLAVGLAGAHYLAYLIAPDTTGKLLYEQMDEGWAIPFVIFIALAPGFMEELFFRGYVQTRLLERWHPLAAILVASSLFALVHVTPHTIVLALSLGIWFGVVAWKTQSIWLTIASHAFVNGGWNILQLGIRFEIFPKSPPVPAIVAFGVVGVASFIMSLWLLGHARKDVVVAHTTPNTPLCLPNEGEA